MNNCTIINYKIKNDVNFVFGKIRRLCDFEYGCGGKMNFIHILMFNKNQWTCGFANEECVNLPA